MTDIDKIKTLFNQRLKEVDRLVKETNKTSVLVIQQFPVNTDVNTLIPNVRESLSNILSFIELGSVNVLKEILKIADGVVDNIVIDSDIKCKHSKQIVKFSRENIKISKRFYYSDNNTWAESAIKFLQQVSQGLLDKRILLAGEGILYQTVKSKLKIYEPNFVGKNEKKSPVDLIIGASVKKQSLGIQHVSLVNNKTQIYDVGIGNFSCQFIDEAIKRGANVYRIDIRAGISSTVLNILETDFLISNVMGSLKIKDTEIVAGGVMGSNGAVIIDDINYPCHVIGVADGQGNLKSQLSEEDEKHISFIKSLINAGK